MRLTGANINRMDADQLRAYISRCKTSTPGCKQAQKRLNQLVGQSKQRRRNGGKNRKKRQA